MYDTYKLKKELLADGRYKLKNSIWSYTGNLGIGKNYMHWLAGQAYARWRAQGHRCTNPKNLHYEHYGAKGVKRLWSSQECVDWYINEIFKRDTWKAPAISRNKDRGNYEVSNVKLKETSVNAREKKLTDAGRLKLSIAAKKNKDICSHPKKVVLINVENSKDKMFFDSGKEGSLSLGFKANAIASAIYQNSNIKYAGKKYKPVQL